MFFRGLIFGSHSYFGRNFASGRPLPLVQSRQHLLNLSYLRGFSKKMLSLGFLIWQHCLELIDTYAQSRKHIGKFFVGSANFPRF